MQLIIENVNLFSSNDIIEGKVIMAITIIAIIPQELFTSERLDVTVLSESLINEPTIGMKFPIANFAVRIDKESTLCVSVL